MVREYLAGDVVTAIAGREKGKLFFVCRSEGSLLYLVDGKHRSMAAPKKKSVGHVRYEASCEEMANRFRAGETVPDRQLRRALAIIRSSVRESGPEEVY